MSTVSTPNAPTTSVVLEGLAHALVSAGSISVQQAEEAMRRANSARISFANQVVASELMTPLELASHASHIFSTPLLDLAAVDVLRLPANLLDSKLCATHQVLPLARRGNRLVLATADPANKAAAQQIKFATQLVVDWVTVECDKLQQALRDSNVRSSVAAMPGFDSEIEFGEIQEVEEPQDSNLGGADVDDVPVVRFFHKMLLDAFQAGASDLHFEPYETVYRVRFRIDGELREVASPPPALKEKLASRIKILSRLDISEKRVPQDGRMKIKIHDRTVDFRVSTLPTLFGEKIVIRILDSSASKIGIDTLGYEEDEKRRLLEAVQRPYGMVLVTGPTGSGKTVSLYSCLSLLNKPGVNISTAEDPSEIQMPGINQVNVNEKAGLTFSAALRSFLRQDPDIIMVGEIRDYETADIAMKAAQTGHLVLSTLHTNDAPTTLTRLLNMGVAPFNIASSVTLITAQRLARRLCKKCKEPVDIPHETLLAAGFTEEALDGSWKPYRAVGCPSCRRGYKGRVGIYQVMPVSEAMQEIILREGNALEIATQARKEGVRTLRESGLLKVRHGVTTLEEVLGTTNL